MKIPKGWKLVPVEPTREILEAIDSVPTHPAAGYYVKLYDAMLVAAPTPPIQTADVWHEGSKTFYRAILLQPLIEEEVSAPARTIPLETLIAEMESNPEMKEAMDKARKTVTLEGLTVSDLPIPPAQEDEPLVENFAKSLVDPCPCCKGDVGFWGRTASRQASALRIEKEKLDKLRKAAEELIKDFGMSCRESACYGSVTRVENLRTALGWKPHE